MVHAWIFAVLVLQGVTNAVAHASGFSPLCGDAHPLVTDSVSALRDYCNLYRDQYDLSCESRTFQLVCAWRIRSASWISRHSFLEEDLVTHFVVLPNFQDDEAMFEGTIENSAALLRQKNTCALCLPWRPARVRTLKTQAERLMAATGHLEDMIATRHQLGVAAVFMTVGDADTLALSSPSV